MTTLIPRASLLRAKTCPGSQVVKSTRAVAFLPGLGAIKVMVPVYSSELEPDELNFERCLLRTHRIKSRLLELDGEDRVRQRAHDRSHDINEWL